MRPMLKQFIADLGGSEVVSQEVSRLSGKTLSARAVYQWPYDETIPPAWRPFVAVMAKTKGVAVPPELESVARLVRKSPGSGAAA